MRTTALRLISLFLAIMPMATMAQSNIKSAFEAIIKCPEAISSESHKLDKDPATNAKTGQCDVYMFVLPADKAGLLKNAVSAFDKDSQMAYSINRGTTGNTESAIQLAVGDASDNGIHINAPDCDYIYALFLAPLSEDPDGKYRYAYGINYKEKDGTLAGKLIVTYATTLKYRQQTEIERKNTVFRRFSNGAIVLSSTDKDSKPTWVETLMSYFQNMPSVNSQTRIALASKAYKVISNASDYPEVTTTDKDTIREILKGMISNKKYSETILNKLLNQCLAILK